jgi:predicted  nucleic acid-binding Zn-ribbon protein
MRRRVEALETEKVILEGRNAQLTNELDTMRKQLGSPKNSETGFGTSMNALIEENSDLKREMAIMRAKLQAISNVCEKCVANNLITTGSC